MTEQKTNLKTKVGRSVFELKMEGGEYSIYCCEYDENGNLYDSERVKNITPNKERAEELFELIVKNRVSACTLRDVIIDLIC